MKSNGQNNKTRTRMKLPRTGKSYTGAELNKMGFDLKFISNTGYRDEVGASKLAITRTERINPRNYLAVDKQNCIFLMTDIGNNVFSVIRRVKEKK